MAEIETHNNPTETDRIGNPSNGGGESKPKVVVIMGPTGSGKSKLSVDLGSHFAVEVINADSMQVYKGLDVLTNKLTINEQKGVAHHLLGTVSPNVEFTAKEFRDSAMRLIDDILSRNCLPVIVGGTNYYIQALISPFLLDDTAKDLDDDCLTISPGEAQPSSNLECEDTSGGYEHLKTIDPVAANRIHPNNHRKINQYLSLYARSGIIPSELLRGKAAEAIGVREFETFLRDYVVETNCDYGNYSTDGSVSLKLDDIGDKILKANMREILNSSNESKAKTLLKEAIDKVKLNTRRLIGRQRRMILRLQKLFEWDIHFLDATESISSKSDDIWAEQVVEPAKKIIRSFLNQEAISLPSKEAQKISGTKVLERELWTQYVCEACGNKVLRGEYEWEQHKHGRNHRKRVLKLRKSQDLFLAKQQHHL